MITYKVEENSNIIAISIDGEITQTDLHQVISEMEAIVDKYRELRIFAEVVAISGTEPGAIWEDLKFAFSHFGHIGRYAVVGDPKWLEPAIHILTPLTKPFTTANIRYFHRDRVEEAWQWLREEIEMLEILPMPVDNAIGLKLKGDLSTWDFERVADIIREKEKVHDKIGIYVEVEKFTGISIPTLLEELKFVFKRFDKFDKKAVVGDKDWMENVVKIGNNIFPNIEVKYFSFDEKDKAKSWIGS